MSDQSLDSSDDPGGVRSTDGLFAYSPVGAEVLALHPSIQKPTEVFAVYYGDLMLGYVYEHDGFWVPRTTNGRWAGAYGAFVSRDTRSDAAALLPPYGSHVLPERAPGPQFELRPVSIDDTLALRACAHRPVSVRAVYRGEDFLGHVRVYDGFWVAVRPDGLYAPLSRHEGGHEGEAAAHLLLAEFHGMRSGRDNSTSRCL